MASRGAALMAVMAGAGAGIGGAQTSGKFPPGLQNEVYVQTHGANGDTRNKVGVASYHFDGEIGTRDVFIHYCDAHHPANWKLANGETPPEKKPFIKQSWDESSRTFSGTIDWTTDAHGEHGGSTNFHGDTRWDYKMTFNADFTRLNGGGVQTYGLNGAKKSYHAYSVNGWQYHKLSDLVNKDSDCDIYSDETTTFPATVSPTAKPTLSPTAKPTSSPTAKPTPSPTSKPTAAAICSPGFYLVESKNKCFSCAEGSFQDATDHSETACKKPRICKPGWFVASKLTSSADRSCEPCPARYWSNEQNSDKCRLWSNCLSNQYVAKPGTPQSDLKCATCPDGTYQDAEKHRNSDCITTTSSSSSSTTTSSTTSSTSTSTSTSTSSSSSSSSSTSSSTSTTTSTTTSSSTTASTIDFDGFTDPNEARNKANELRNAATLAQKDYDDCVEGGSDAPACAPLKRRANEAGKLASQAEAVADTLESAVTTTDSAVQSASGDKDKGTSTTLLVVIVLVVLVIIIAVIVIAVVLKRKNGADTARSADMVSFENPMYASTDAQTAPQAPFAQPTPLYDDAVVNGGAASSGAAGYAEIPAATGTPAGYMDVSPNATPYTEAGFQPYADPGPAGAAGYMDVTPNAKGGYMDVAPTAPATKGGYMDVAPNHIEGDFSDEEDV